MRKKLRLFDKSIDRLGYWFGGYTIMSGFFGWLSSQLVWAKGLGWAEYSAIGLLAAGGLGLVTAAILAAWRYFRPLPVTILPARTIAETAPADVDPPKDLSPPPSKRATTIPAHEIDEKLEAIEELRGLDSRFVEGWRKWLQFSWVWSRSWNEGQDAFAAYLAEMERMRLHYDSIRKDVDEFKSNHAKHAEITQLVDPMPIGQAADSIYVFELLPVLKTPR